MPQSILPSASISICVSISALHCPGGLEHPAAEVQRECCGSHHWPLTRLPAPGHWKPATQFSVHRSAGSWPQMLGQELPQVWYSCPPQSAPGAHAGGHVAVQCECCASHHMAPGHW